MEYVIYTLYILSNFKMYILELDFVSSHNKIAVTKILVYMILVSDVNETDSF